MSTINWLAVGTAVQQGVTALTPLIDVAAPEAAPALDIINAVLKGAVAAEPVAVALVAQIKSGMPPTPEQLQTVIAAYRADDDALAQDIAAHIAALADGGTAA